MSYVQMKVFTEEQVLTVEPNEVFNGVILIAKEADDKTYSDRMYLDVDQMKSLIKILEFQLTEILNQK